MHSMTGYGKAENTNKKFQISVEVKSVNSRYLDISIKQPAVLAPFEPLLRDLVKKNVLRGKIAIYVDLQLNPSGDADTLVNARKLEFYLRSLEAINNKLPQKTDISLEHLLQFSELFEPELDESDIAIIEPLLTETTQFALQAFNAMRAREGEHLKNDMDKRIRNVADSCARIKGLSKNAAREEFDKLYARLLEMIDSARLDRERLEQEIAILSDRVDISEELTRLKSHLKQFAATLQSKGEVGKKLTFILQEMHREANTINSKTANVDVSHEVIAIKEAVEKIREQAQNIE